MEAFCDICFCPLCINCILSNGHKNHDIISLQGAAEKTKIEIYSCFNNRVSPFTSETDQNLETLISIQTAIKNKKDEQAEKVVMVFDQIRATVDSLERDAFALINRSFNDLKLLTKSTE